MNLPENRNQRPLDDDEREKATYLIDKYESVLIIVAMKILRNIHDAEEAVQAAFESVFHHLDKIVDCDSKEAANYLIITLKHICFKELTRQKLMKELPVKMADDIDRMQSDEMRDPVWDEIRNKMTRQQLTEAVKKLDETNRLLLIGRYYLNMSYKELSELAQISTSSVSTRLVRAKRELAKILAEQNEVKE